ncbi:MAG TPA: AHH domain-containing protein, partial [Myxococcus sp.]|nr:AHH domain-containing protein [Myxococcus sp.]
VLKGLSKAQPGGPGVEAALPGGVRLRLPVPQAAAAEAAVEGGQVVSVAVVGDRFVVAMAAGAGGTVGGGPPPGGGSGAAGSACAPAPSSKRLAANMEAAGVKRPPGTDAHHIVAANAEAASTARGVLRRFRVDIDDAANGVFLPSNSNVATTAPGSIHSTIHTKKYYDTVNDDLIGATSRQEVLNILALVRQRLLQGTYP